MFIGLLPAVAAAEPSPEPTPSQTSATDVAQADPQVDPQLQALLDALVQLDRHGHLAIVTNENQRALRPFQATALDEVFDLHDSLEDALRACATASG